MRVRGTDWMPTMKRRARCGSDAGQGSGAAVPLGGTVQYCINEALRPCLQTKARNIFTVALGRKSKTLVSSRGLRVPQPSPVPPERVPLDGARAPVSVASIRIRIR